MDLLRAFFSINAIFSGVLSWNGSSLLPENHLRRKLFEGYDPNVFPAPRDNSKFQVRLQAIVKSLDSVDIRSTTATISVVFNVAWKNHQLKWKGSEFDSVPFIFSKVSDVWTPMITQVESGKILSTGKEGLLKVSKDGRCTFPMINQVVGKCNTDIKSYPHDVHKCVFTFYTYNLYTSFADLELIMEGDGDETINGAWSFTTMAIEVNITRKPSYARRKILLPLCLLAFVPVVNHLLPVETGERIGFSMTGLLTMMLTIQYAMDQLPEVDEEPLTVYVGRLSLFFMMVSLMMTTIILNVYHKKGRPMPRPLQRILRVVCRYVLISYPSKNAVTDIGSDNENSDDWLILSRALDRICLPIFITVMILAVFPMVL
ncbi:acetylcholine receptor subunit beta-like isoform X2 [Rhopilema esculentum]|uniref:acetylcholine receptor subunit beta-like isoform X2 n=1 Tax=Rhopilema esculentum TaxID=499914 RepID=UPI0031E249CB